MTDIALIIHGPVSEENYHNILSSLGDFCQKVKIVVVGYKFEKQKLLAALGKENLQNYKLCLVNDLINPGFANINRQLNMLKEGLKYIDDDEVVIKLRNDQCVNFSKLFNLIKVKQSEFDSGKLLTTNCYTRRDRLYHPSDMFIVAKGKTLKEYFSCPFMQENDLETRMAICERIEKGDNLSFNPISPESYLFRNFLKLKRWKFEETYSDSFKALSEYILLINTWDIELTWHKKRNYPFTKTDEIILPHHLTLAPFPGAPVEKARCFSRHDFDGQKSFKDIFYLVKSRLVWLCWYENLESPKRMIESKYYDCRTISSDCINRIKRFPSSVLSTIYLLFKEVYTLSKLIIYRLLMFFFRFK